jgi:hypothetical protein
MNAYDHGGRFRANGEARAPAAAHELEDTYVTHKVEICLREGLSGLKGGGDDP